MQTKMLSVLSRTTLLLVLLFLAACNSKSGSGSNTGSAGGNENPADIHVGFVSETASLNFASEMAAGAQYAANQFHVSAQIVAPPQANDQAAVQLFENLTKTARDGIAVETLAPDLFVRSEADAVSGGIPIIAVDTVPPAAANIETYVGNDNIAAGKMLADAAIELLPNVAGGSLVLGNPVLGLPVLDYRVQGIQEEFEQSRPNIQILGPFQTTLEPQPNFSSWNSLITAHPDIIVGLGVGDQDNVSLATIKQTNHGAYLSGAFDLNQAAIQAVANGTNFALVDPEHFLKGYIAMRLLIEHALMGKAIPKGWWNSGALLVTQRNVQDIITRQVNLEAKGRFYQPVIDKEFSDPTALIKPIDQAK